MTGLVTAILLLIALGIVFFLGKGGFLLSGWNSMSPEERAEYDEKKFFRNMSAMMFSCAGCLALALLGSIWEAAILRRIGFLLLIPCLLFFAARANTAKKK